MPKLLQKKINALVACILIVLAAFAGWGIGRMPQGETIEKTSLDALYENAVTDAMTIETNEILPLISLDEGAPYATYDEQGRLLLLTYNATPENYPSGAVVTLDSGDVWLTAPAEFAAWFDTQKESVEDWPLRLRQLLGLPANDPSDSFTAMWVEPENVLRPANVQDIGDITMTSTLSSDTSAEFKEWFDANTIWSYFDSAYPWTRLGYTYDWASDAEDEYGLSEFLVPKGTSVEIAYTVSEDEMLAHLANGSFLL